MGIWKASGQELTQSDYRCVSVFGPYSFETPSGSLIEQNTRLINLFPQFPTAADITVFLSFLVCISGHAGSC